ncbi:glycoside hydrolase family 15 protein [Nocardiopsis sp. NPDC055551]
MRSRLQARPDFGRSAASWRHLDGALKEASGPLLSGDRALVLLDEEDPELRVELSESETAVFALDYLRGERRVSPGEGHALLRTTLDAWRLWSDRTHYDGVGASHVRRSALVLCGLLHEESGGLIAAPTTSLTEDPGGVRNWDYRYVWHRDAALMGLTTHKLSRLPAKDPVSSRCRSDGVPRAPRPWRPHGRVQRVPRSRGRTSSE